VRKALESLQAPRQVAATARRYGISRSLLLRWRQSFRPEPNDVAEQPVGFVPARVVQASGTTPGPVEPAGAIEIEFEAGVRMRITGEVDAFDAEGSARSAG
jgi:transposase